MVDKDDELSSLNMFPNDDILIGGRSESSASGDKSENSIGHFDFWPVKLSFPFVDTIPPVPDIANLPTLTGECSVNVTTTPTATDNVDGLIIGTTTDSLII